MPSEAEPLPTYRLQVVSKVKSMNRDKVGPELNICLSNIDHIDE